MFYCMFHFTYDRSLTNTPQHACVGRHLATRNEMRVSGSRLLCVDAPLKRNKLYLFAYIYIFNTEVRVVCTG